MTAHKHIILYAEDDPDDVLIVKQAFEHFDGTIQVIDQPDGRHALRCLEELNRSGLLPCLIILDMNMPAMNGRETLVKIRTSPEFRHIPVVLFTTSSSKMDQEFAGQWNADFITKPVLYSDLEMLARTFVERCDSEMNKRA
jgi:CheY-like chemotaxis protein